MTDNPLIPAAQYLRMSTEHQQYSLQNQIAAIERYAETQRFSVVRTYSDAARSGVVLRRRSGLRELLRDVVGGTPGYRAILFYVEFISMLPDAPQCDLGVVPWSRWMSAQANTRRT